MIEIRRASVTSKEAVQLIEELSSILENITGSSGNASFQADALKAARTIFVIAYSDGEPVGCGALQNYSNDIAEIKRVYSKIKGVGIGTQILWTLEEYAYSYGYRKIVLETRKINTTAVRFYQKSGYRICPNYGKYTHHEEAVCFYKSIV